MKTASIIICSVIVLFTSAWAQWSQNSAAPQVYLRSIAEINGNLYLSSVGSGVFKSTDNGISWQSISNGLISQQSKDTYEVIETGGAFYVATTDGIYKSTNGGDNWVKKSNGITIGPGALYEFTESIFEYSGNLFTGAWNGLYRSSDNAENWVITNVSGEGIEAKNFTEHNGILFAARESINNPIGYKSLDGGNTWQDLTGLSFLNTITFYSEPGKLWAGAIGGVWLSTDDGVSWVERNNGLNLDPYSSSIIRVNGVLITALKFGGSGIYITNDDGLNWEDFSDGLTFINSIDKLIAFDNKIFAATSAGLWQRDIFQVPVEFTSFSATVSGINVNLNWTTATEINNKGFEIQRSEVKNQKSDWKKIGFIAGFGTTTEPKAYSFTDNKVSAGTYSYRLKQTDFDGSFGFSSIVNVKVDIPNEFHLSQNFPNPFNPVTIINYMISDQARNDKLRVTLKVYNALGEEAATLVNEEKPAGRYSVKFDGSKLSSGIYYYRITAGSFAETRKMILMK